MDREYVSKPRLTGDIIIRGGRVVDTHDGTVSQRDVRLSAGVVAEIGDVAEDSTPVLDARGRYLVPGLSDMHAHALNEPDDVEGAYALMLAAGVSGFRQMSGSADLLALRSDGRLPHPLGAPTVLAMPGDILTPFNASSSARAAATVREQKSAGADFIKAALIGGDVFRAALAESRRIGIPLVGHLPGDVDALEASRAGMRSIEHLGPGPSLFAGASRDPGAILARSASRRGPRIPPFKIPGMDGLIRRIIQGIVVNPAARTTPEAAATLQLADDLFDDEAAETLAQVFIENETWQCPTLIRVRTQQLPNAPEHRDDARVRFIRPDELARWRKSAARFEKLPTQTKDILEQHFAAQLRLTKVLADAGVPMLAGTDADGAGWVIPGLGLHDEFELLATAGLSPLKILQLATVEPARFLNRPESAGRLLVGSPADIVILDGDPVADHRALLAIDGVIRDASYWSRDDLDGILERIAAQPGAA